MPQLYTYKSNPKRNGDQGKEIIQDFKKDNTKVTFKFSSRFITAGIHGALVIYPPSSQ
jgi:hypothetical protein